MRTHSASLAIALLSLATACGGGDSGGGTAPPTVASVAITPAASPPTIRTLGRTVQFSAQAATATGAAVTGATFNWTSSAPGVASVNASGLVTAVANGSAGIRASSVPGGVLSPEVLVTVDQVADELRITPASVTFGALGSTRQLMATLLDSSDFALPSAAAVTWSAAGPGTFAGVAASGLVTALAVGTGDTAVATAGALTTKVPIAVTQLVATIGLVADGPDTLRTTTRTRTYTATPRDSNSNVMNGLTPTWSSTDAAVATVAPNGVATAVGDGGTSIRATLNSVVGSRNLTVRRYAETFQLAPATAALSAPAASQAFTATVRDSLDTDLPVGWLIRSATIASLSAATGASVTVTAAGNGMTFLIMSGGTRVDSAAITVSGQVSAPLTAAVAVGDNYFRSAQNATQNAAVDTIGVGGTVTWTWSGSNTHNVFSVPSPSFTSSPLQSSGTHVHTFGSAGTYAYQCQIHPQMTGQVVVR